MTPGTVQRAGNAGSEERSARAASAGRATASASGVAALVICAAMLLILPFVAAAQIDATETFRKANGLYGQGEYDRAAELYESILESGFRNADVLYNLGNASFKSGNLGEAVLAYERALKLDPGHEDAAANLEFVQSLLADRRAPVGGPFSEFLARVNRRLTGARLALFASAFYFILFGFLTIRVLRGGMSPWFGRAAVVAAVALIVSGGLLLHRLSSERARVEAVVMVPEVAVRTGPGEDFLLEFRLHEGTTVSVEERRGEWARVALKGTDLEGWMPAGDAEEI
jgi:tetratricopeptide (TPR) repeat protein